MVNSLKNQKMQVKGRKIVIIGNGVAGITCARHIRKNDSSAEISVISGESTHFFSRTALMYIYMGHMKYEHTKPYEVWFWQKNRISLIHDWVKSVDFASKKLKLEASGALEYEILVLATGSRPNKFGWSGQDLKGVQGLYSLQDLESMERDTQGVQRGVVVGGGLIGIEMAEMLKSRNIHVTFLVREKSFWNNILPPQESEMINRHIREHHIDLRLQTELSEVIDDGSGKAGAVTTLAGEKIDCQFVGLTAGVNPNIAFLKDTELETELGVLVDAYFATSIQDVYAIGDCAQFRKAPAADRKLIEQVWYTARIHGETLAQTLTKEKTAYKPGPWFNSAKFFDIEYQTYGYVPAQWGEEMDSFYWEHPDGKICLRLLFKKANMEFVGVNTLGMRLRHAFFDKALKEKWTVGQVLSRFSLANFDPEFFKKHHEEIILAYNKKFDEQLSVQKAPWYKRLLGV